MMLSIFPCAHWPFVCLLQTNVYSYTLPIFKLGYLSFYCWVISSLYIFWILDPYQIYDLQIFSHSPFLKFFLFLILFTFFIVSFDAQKFLFVCLFVLATPQGMWDLSSPTRDRTHAPALGARSLNQWTAREVPMHKIFNFDEVHFIPDHLYWK